MMESKFTYFVEKEVKKNVYDMFDYILFLPDGSYEGNETGKIIEKMNKN